MKNILPEALSIIREAEKKFITLRLFGGCAVKYLVTNPLIERNEPNDIDFVCKSHDIFKLYDLFEQLGYIEEKSITLQYGSNRRRFHSKLYSLIIDLSIDKLIFNRVIDLRGRLNIREISISVSDLILSKLQIKKPGRKDFIDLVNMFHEFDMGTIEDEQNFKKKRIVRICSNDWGLEKIADKNLEDLIKFVDKNVKNVELTKELEELKLCISRGKKTIKWHLKAIFGNKKNYWNDVSDESNF